MKGKSRGKLFFVIVILFIASVVYINADETSDIIKKSKLITNDSAQDIKQVNLTNYNFLKRTVTIFALSGNINDYNYASKQYQTKISEKLQNRGLFVTKTRENSIDINKINKKSKNQLQDICKQNLTDIIIFGNSFIEKNRKKNKKITIQVYDFILNEIILQVNITIGSVIQGEIESATEYMAEELNQFYLIFNKLKKPFITDKYIKNLIKLSRSTDENSKIIANNILNQNEAEIKYRIKFDKINEYFPVFFNKNNIIFINTDYVGEQQRNFIKAFKNRNKVINKTPEEVKKEREELERKKQFTITVNNQKFTTREKILILAIPPNKYKKLLFTIQKYGKKPIKLFIFPKENSKVTLRNITSVLRRKMPDRRFYLDILHPFTTTGFLGIGMRFGIALPQKDSKLEMSIFTEIQYASKIFLFNQNLPSDMEGWPDIKLTFSFGFKRMFYIKNFIGIGIGFKFGIENYFLRFIKIQDKVIVFGRSFPYGYLSFICSIPIEIELPSFSRFNFFLGVEPTFRLSLKFFVYDKKAYADTFYIDNLENPFHMDIISDDKTMYPDIGIDFFFNDMPIVVGLRIKL